MGMIADAHAIVNNVQKIQELLFWAIALLLIIIGEIISLGPGTSLRRMFMLNVLFVLWPG